jgi:hypothetical protein
MRRSATALGASLLALALTAGPALAEPGVAQTVDDSTGAAQVGAVNADVPVRVLSDGEDSQAGVTTGAPQTTSDSTGAAQAGPVEVDAPVRVASDGDDADAGGATGGPQTTSDSAGSGQVGSLTAATPVRVLSDGDGPEGGSGSAATPQTVGGSTGALQVGSPSLYAPARVLSEGGAGPGDDGSDGGGVPQVSPPAEGEDAPGAPEGLRRLVDDGGTTLDERPAVEFTSTTTSGGGGVETSMAGVLGASETKLPLTGLGSAAMAAMGLWLLSGGLALRLVPGGKRR